MKQQDNNTQPGKKHVPRWLQNELYKISEPVMDKFIESHKEIGFNRFGLQSIAEQLVCHGYFHANPNPPEDKPTPQPVQSLNEGEWKPGSNLISEYSSAGAYRIFDGNLNKPETPLAIVYGKRAKVYAELFASSPKLLEENKALKEQLKAMYDLAEKMGMIMTSDQWTEKFRSEFNPIMTKTETLL